MSEKLKNLRMGLVNHRFDSMPNVTVRFHYDKMRRVSLENFNYYYAPLPRTPFSLGLAIPAYENTYIQYEDVVTKFNQLGINITEFFAGSNWKVHQDWYIQVFFTDFNIDYLF